MATSTTAVQPARAGRSARRSSVAQLAGIGARLARASGQQLRLTRRAAQRELGRSITVCKKSEMLNVLYAFLLQFLILLCIFTSSPLITSRRDRSQIDRSERTGSVSARLKTLWGS